MPPETTATLDCRGVKCPLNFVKTRLALEKLNPGEVLEVWLDASSDSVMNVPSSIEQEGHTVLHQQPHSDESDVNCLWVRRK